MLRSQDVVVVLQLRAVASEAGQAWTYAGLAGATGLSASQAHASVERLKAAGLVRSDADEPLWVPAKALGTLLQHAVPLWLYPETQGPPGAVRGIPTAWSGPPLSSVMQSDRVVVWPHPQGESLGESVAPLHACVLKGACVPGHRDYNARLHEVLALVDALRLGRARDRREAMKFLVEWGYAS